MRLQEWGTPICGDIGSFEFGLGFVEGDIGDLFLRGSQIDDGLGRWMVAPGAGGVEVGDEFGEELGGEGFTVKLLREAGGEVLEEGQTDDNGVAGCPGGWLVAEESELEREVGTLGFHGGVDSAGVELQPVHLIGREGSEGTVCGGAELEGALEAVVGDHALAEDFGHVAGDEAAEGVHLPETVLCRDVALGDDEIVERGGADVGDAVDVALDGDRGGEAGDGDAAVELREGVVHGSLGPMAGGEEGDDDADDQERDEDDKYFEKDVYARGPVGRLVADDAVKERILLLRFGFVAVHSADFESKC